MTGENVFTTTLNTLVVLCALRNNFRFASAAIAYLEIVGELQSYLARSDRPADFKRNGSTAKGTRLRVRGEVQLQKMKMRRIVNWTAGL